MCMTAHGLVSFYQVVAAVVAAASLSPSLTGKSAITRSAALELH